VSLTVSHGPRTGDVCHIRSLWTRISRRRMAPAR